MQYTLVIFTIAAFFLCGSEAQTRRFPYERLLGTMDNTNIAKLQSMFQQAQQAPQPTRLPNMFLQQPQGESLQNMFMQSPQVPDCPLEMHPDTETMFIMRGPLGDPQPRTCPAGTYFLRSVCSCVNRPATENGKTPLTECNLRPSAVGQGWYEENVFGVWVHRPCGPGSAYSPATCDCSLTI